MSYSVPPRALFVLLSILLPGAAAWAQSSEDARLISATQVLDQLQSTPDQNVPTWLLDRAYGVAVIPDVLKGAFVFGGRHGSGCRRECGDEARGQDHRQGSGQERGEDRSQGQGQGSSQGRRDQVGCAQGDSEASGQGQGGEQDARPEERGLDLFGSIERADGLCDRLTRRDRPRVRRPGDRVGQASKEPSHGRDRQQQAGGGELLVPVEA